MNGYLGGSGSDFRNLTPLSREGNGNHERQVEALVIAQVDAGKTVEYSVTPGAGSPRTITDAQLQAANVPAAKWATLRDIISAEGFVPSGLNCVANVLDDATGLVQQSIVSTTTSNPIDLSLANYET